MLRRAGTFLLAVLAMLVFYGTASAKMKKVRVAILPVQVKGLPGKVGKQLGAVVMRELREIGVFQVVPGKVTWRKLQQLKKRKIFTSNCTEKTKCVRTVGRALRAKVLFFMSVTKEEGGVSVSMRTFDVKSGTEVRESSELASEEDADLERATRWTARLVSSPMLTTLAKGKGHLQVNCEEPEADLYLNGKNYKKRTGKSFKVSSGVFDIQVKHEGYETFHDVVVVKPGQKQEVDAKLEPKGETKPVEVAAVTPEETEKKEETKAEKKPDLPPWAVFEKKEGPKSQETGEKKEAASKEKEEAKGEVMPWQQITKSKAYLPDTEKQPEPTKKEETHFYETWWFWTVTAVVVAGAGGAATWYFLTREEGGSGYGNATVTWQ